MKSSTSWMSEGLRGQMRERIREGIDKKKYENVGSLLVERVRGNY